LNAEGVTGSLVQSINHGISTGALFLLVGMIYERRHTRLIEDYGGIWTAMPSYGVVFIIAMLSSVALPGLNGFVGEFPILVGAFERYAWYAVFAATGMILGAIYLFWMFQRVFQGPLTEANRSLKDMTPREWSVILPLILLMFGIGLYPKALTDRLQPSVNNFLETMNPAASVAQNTGSPSKLAMRPRSESSRNEASLTVANRR
jgi:NADH-quinone oxidoreductase subunit M